MNNCKKLFADKLEVKRNFKVVKENVKEVKENKETKEKTEKWLLAKKGLSCGSCDNYLGRAKEGEHLNWNQYPIREGESIYRVGTSFSKMLQRANVENMLGEQLAESQFCKTEDSFMRHRRTTSVEERKHFMRPKIREIEAKETVSEQFIVEDLEPQMYFYKAER